MLSSLGVCLKKVSLYLNENLWNKFKEAVLRRHGTLRRLSSEVEELLRTSLVDEDVEQAFMRMNVDMKIIFSPEGVKQGRPKLQGPPSEIIIREMRGRRIAEGLS
jgi:hypothetical protein